MLLETTLDDGLIEPVMDCNMLKNESSSNDDAAEVVVATEEDDDGGIDVISPMWPVLL